MLKDKRSDSLLMAQDESAKKLGELFAKGPHGLDDDEVDYIKSALSLQATYTKLRSVEAHESVLGFQIAQSVSVDTPELKEMLRKSLPEYVEE